MKFPARSLVALLALVAAFALASLGATAAVASQASARDAVRQCHGKFWSPQSKAKRANAARFRRCVQQAKSRAKRAPKPSSQGSGATVTKPAVPTSEGAPTPSPAPTQVPVEAAAPTETAPATGEGGSLQEAAPPAAVSTPPVEVSLPPVEVKVPPVEVTVPPVEVTVPPVEVTVPPVEIPVPPVETPKPPSGPINFPQSLVVGIDGGWAGWGWNEIQQRTALGASVTRHEWITTEPVNAQDSLVYAAASQIHTRIHALLGDNELGDPTAYREYVVAFIRRYGLGGTFWKEHPELNEAAYAITTFELGNEPYFGAMTASNYAQTIRPTLEEVKRLGLPAEIVLPNRTEGSNVSWMETLYRTIPNLNNLFYAFAEHPYWYGHEPAARGNGGPFARIATTRQKMNALGAAAKPIFITEYGESTGTCGSECVTEATQAQHLQEMIEGVTSHPEWGIGMLLLFQLNDYGSHSEREGNFGLLRTSGAPKPAYSVVAEAVQRYRG
jgi:hypothetical protein